MSYDIEVQVHRKLKPHLVGGEWYRMAIDDAIQALLDLAPGAADKFIMADPDAPTPRDAPRRRGPPKGSIPKRHEVLPPMVEETPIRPVNLRDVAKKAQSVLDYAERLKHLTLI